MKKTFITGCLVVVVLAVFLVIGLIFLALRSSPAPTTAEALASLPEKEFAALTALCKAAGLEATSLRNIWTYESDLFDHPDNTRSMVVRDNHVKALCLRGVTFTTHPQFDGFPELKALDLSGSSLHQWPDLSSLSTLAHLTLTGVPLPEADANLLPRNLQVLEAEKTNITSVAPFANLLELKTINLAGTRVQSFDSLMGLKLDTLNLSNTRITNLPPEVPKEGGWEVNLDGTPVRNPPGYSIKWPLDSWVKNQSAKDDVVQGIIAKSQVEVRGSVEKIEETRGIRLVQGTDPNAPIIILEATCRSGRARIWLVEPTDFFPSPWMIQRKVVGFGTLRRPGYVSCELSPESPARLRGNLSLTTESRIYDMPAGQRSEALAPPPWCHYSFYIEPLGGAAVTGLQFTILSTP
jgi:hypothetical protein